MSKLNIFAFLLFISFLSISITHFAANNRTFNDSYDIDKYMKMGSWYVLDKKPYQDIRSVYPQLATYMFAIPYLFNDDLNDLQAYRTIHSLMMDLALACLIILIFQFRTEKKYLAFILLLPACFYFSHNRYDVIPSLLVTLSLVSLFKERHYQAVIYLALAIMFKWYALVLVPIYISYYFRTEKIPLYKLTVIFFITIAIVVLPTIISIGFEDFYKPYRHHLNRGTNQESLLYLIYSSLHPWWQSLNKQFLLKMFFILQFSVAFLAIFAKIDEKQKVLYWSIASVAAFMVFAKFYSPQWILWLSPLLLLINGSGFFWFMVISFDIVTYIYFPTIFGFRKSDEFLLLFLFHSIIMIKTLYLLYFLNFSIKKIYGDINIKFSFSLPGGK